MANIAGSSRLGVAETNYPDTTTTSWPMPGSVRVLSIEIGDNPPVYKNKGWYAVGGVYETWISVGTPSLFNSATGHGSLDFTYLQHIMVRA